MTDAAVLDATYVNFTPLKNGQIKIILEVPRHKLQKLIDVLGPPPDQGNTTWVAVARLANEPAT